jgi:hypothetical protein
MHLPRRKRTPRGAEASDAAAAARTAGAEAAERLADASEVRAGAERQAAHEQHTIVSELRAIRERNHLADLILESVQRGGRQS